MIHEISRRTLFLAGGVTMLAATARASERKRLALELKAQDLVPRPDDPAMKAWRFVPGSVPRFAQGDALDVTVTNSLPVPAHIFFRGLDGAAELEPFLARLPIPPGGSANYVLDLAHAGTLICDARLGGGDKPLPVLPIVVTENVRYIADNDEVLLIEAWRPQAGGDPVYTLNGQTELKLEASGGGRKRLRLVNGTQRAVLAVEFSGVSPVIIGIDGQPSEMFPARDGRLVLAPGTRIDTVLEAYVPFAMTLHDGSRRAKLAEWSIVSHYDRPPGYGPAKPLLSNGLPERIELQSALRATLDLDSGAGWIAADAMSPKLAPAFKVAKGRPVVLTLNNPGEATSIFHLHGHHMRLLDRLDDGWKPFWLDTVAVPAKQMVRVAFAATNPGAYLMEAYKSEWASARGFRSYLVTA